jgi:hypothetical protein
LVSPHALDGAHHAVLEEGTLDIGDLARVTANQRSGLQFVLSTLIAARRAVVDQGQLLVE